MPEQLPVPLALPRPKHLMTERRNLDDYEIYSSLSNFRNMVIPTDLWTSIYFSHPIKIGLIEW